MLKSAQREETVLYHAPAVVDGQGYQQGFGAFFEDSGYAAYLEVAYDTVFRAGAFGEDGCRPFVLLHALGQFDDLHNGLLGVLTIDIGAAAFAQVVADAGNAFSEFDL